MSHIFRAHAIVSALGIALCPPITARGEDAATNWEVRRTSDPMTDEAGFEARLVERNNSRETIEVSATCARKEMHNQFVDIPAVEEATFRIAYRSKTDKGLGLLRSPMPVHIQRAPELFGQPIGSDTVTGGGACVFTRVRVDNVLATGRLSGGCAGDNVATVDFISVTQQELAEKMKMMPDNNDPTWRGISDLLGKWTGRLAPPAVATTGQVFSAHRFLVELPLNNGTKIVVDLHPQDPTFKAFGARCDAAYKPPPAAPRTSGEALGVTLLGPAEKRASRVYPGRDLEGFVAALPDYLKRAAAGIGAPSRSYDDEIAFIADTARRCAGINAGMATGTVNGRPVVNTAKLGAPYRACDAPVGIYVPRPAGKMPELLLGIHPQGIWGEAKSMTVIVSYTDVGYPGSRSETGRPDYGIASAVVGTLTSNTAPQAVQE